MSDPSHGINVAGELVLSLSAAPGYHIEAEGRGFRVRCELCGGSCLVEGNGPAGEMPHAAECTMRNPEVAALIARDDLSVVTVARHGAADVMCRRCTRTIVRLNQNDLRDLDACRLALVPVVAHTQACAGSAAPANRGN